MTTIQDLIDWLTAIGPEKTVSFHAPCCPWAHGIRKARLPHPRRDDKTDVVIEIEGNPEEPLPLPTLEAKQ